MEKREYDLYLGIVSVLVKLVFRVYRRDWREMMNIEKKVRG